MLFKRYKIRRYESGLYFRDEEFVGLLGEGRHWFFDPLGKVRVDIVSHRSPWLVHDKLDVIAKSGAFQGKAVVLDLNDHQRGLVWIDGRFSQILSPGLSVYWLGARDVKVEIVDARQVRLDHPQLPAILRCPMATQKLIVQAIGPGHVGVLYVDGCFVDTLSPGRYAFWKDEAPVELHPVDMREQMIDIGGQEIMTADKVTLRLNLAATYRVADVRRMESAADNAIQALYRRAQLVVREVVGKQDLDAFLTDKEQAADTMEKLLRRGAEHLGLEVVSVGVRDIILPGEMKDLMNKVTEAKKAAEADLIARREETAAMRSQANTAKLLENNPMLMKLRELELLEKIAASADLRVVLGEKGLAEKVANLL